MDIPENHYGLHNGSGKRQFLHVSPSRRRLPRSSKAAFSETPWNKNVEERDATNRGASALDEAW
jgi:hypothetical protein